MELIKVVVWPLTTIIVICCMAVFLRRELRSLLPRMVSARLPGGTELSFGNAEVDKNSQTHKPINAEEASQSVSWRKVGNLYWLGHDLMWSIDVTLREAPGSDILYGIRQCMHHATELGLSVLATRLGRLYSTITRFDMNRLTIQEREQISLELRRITDQFGAIAEAADPTFRGRPDGND